MFDIIILRFLQNNDLHCLDLHSSHFDYDNDDQLCQEVKESEVDLKTGTSISEISEFEVQHSTVNYYHTVQPSQIQIVEIEMQHNTLQY